MENEFCDVTLACDDKQVLTHKEILSSSSLALNYNNISQEPLK